MIRTWVIRLDDLSLNVPVTLDEDAMEIDVGRPWKDGEPQVRLTPAVEALARPVAWGEVEGRS